MCMRCVAHVKKALEKMDGVVEVEVSLEENNAIVTCERDITAEEFKAIIEAEDYIFKGMA